MKTITKTNQFKKEYKLMMRRGKSSLKFEEVIQMLLHDFVIPQKHRDHFLSGNYKGSRELHIEPDWLLIYCNSEDELILERTGTHSDLFDK